MQSRPNQALTTLASPSSHPAANTDAEEKPYEKPIPPSRPISDPKIGESKDEKKDPISDEPDIKRARPLERKLKRYNKRLTLTQTGPGIEFQVLWAMHWAFYYTYQKPTEFELLCEAIDYGDFDDVVIIILSETTNAYQYKARKKEEEDATFSHFVSEGGSNKELMLHKYFDSIYGRLDKENEAFFLVSNQPPPPELIPYLEDGCFSDQFLNGADFEAEYLRNVIVASINKYAENRAETIPNPPISVLARFLANYLDRNKKLTGQDQYTSGIGKKIFDFVSSFNLESKRFSQDQKKGLIDDFLRGLQEGSHSLDAQESEDFVKMLTSICPLPGVSINLYDIACANAAPNFELIQKFLKKLRIQFSSPNSSQLKEALRKNIREKFNVTSEVIFQAFYAKFHAWLIDKQGTVFDNAMIENAFDHWKNNYIYLERLYGLTDVSLKNIEAKLSDGHYFDRRVDLSRLSKEEGRHNILFLLGEAGIGKSCLAKKYIDQQQLTQNQTLFVDIRDFCHLAQDFTKQTGGNLIISYFDNIKLIFIDNAELAIYDKKLKDFLVMLAEQSQHSNLKLIFLSRHKEIDVGLSEEVRQRIKYLTLQPLPLYQVLQRYPSLKNLINRDELAAMLDDEEVDSDLTPLPQSHELEEVKESTVTVASSLGYKGVIHLLTVPFYLNLILRHQEQLSAEIRNFHPGYMQLTHFIITLVIEQRGKPKSGLMLQDSSKLRVSVLRKVLYAKNKQTMDLDFFDKLSKPEQAIVRDLVNEDILVRQVDSGKEIFHFSHLIYEEWITHNIVTSRLESTIEAEDDLGKLITDLNQLLPKMTYCWERMLNTNLLLDSYLANKYAAQYLPEVGNFAVLLRAAIFTHNQTLFHCARPYVSSLTLQLLQWQQLVVTPKLPITDLVRYRGACIFCVDTDYSNYAELSIYFINDNGKAIPLDIIEEGTKGSLAYELADILNGADDPQSLKIVANPDLINRLRKILAIYGGSHAPNNIPITFLGDAVDAENIEAAQFLLEDRNGLTTHEYNAPSFSPAYEGTATGYKIEVRNASDMARQHRADATKKSNWSVYSDFDIDPIDEHELVPYKYIFREGRENSHAWRIANNSDDPRQERAAFEENCFDREKINEENAAFLADHFFYFNKARNTGNQKMIELLLARSDREMRNRYFETALHLAVLAQDRSLVATLLRYDFVVDATDYDGETALHNAIYCSQFFKKHAQHKIWANDEEDHVCYQIFNMLLQVYSKRRGALYKKNLMGWSPLHLAVLMRDPVMISALVKAGALNSLQDCKIYLLENLWGWLPESRENAWLFSKTPFEVHYYYGHGEVREIVDSGLEEWLIKQGIFAKCNMDGTGSILDLEKILTEKELAQIKERIQSYAVDFTNHDRQKRTPQDLIRLVNQHCREQGSSVHALSLEYDAALSIDTTRQPSIRSFFRASRKIITPSPATASSFVAPTTGASVANAGFFSSARGTTEQTLGDISTSSIAASSSLSLGEGILESKAAIESTRKRKERDPSNVLEEGRKANKRERKDEDKEDNSKASVPPQI